MKLTPLFREVRRVRTMASGEAKSGLVGRWVLLAGVYAIIVLLTCTYFLRPLPPGGGDILTDEVIVQATFSIVPPSLRKRWDDEVEAQHGRVWDYRASAGPEVLAQLNALLEKSSAIDPTALTPAELVAVLRRQDNRLTVSEEDAVQFVTILRDARFQEALNSLVEGIYRDYLVTDDSTKLRAHLASNLADIEGEVPELRMQVEDRVLATRDLSDWSPLVAKTLEGRIFLDRNIDEMRAAALQLLATILRPNVVWNQERTDRSREEMRLRIPAEFSRAFRVGDVLIPSPRADGGLASVRQFEEGDEEYVLLQEHRRVVRAQRFGRLPGHMIYVLLVLAILSFYIRKSGQGFSFTAFNVVLISIPVILALSIMAVVLAFSDGNPELVGFFFPAGMIGMLGVLLLDVRLALLLVTWGCLLLALQVDLRYEFVITGLFGGYTGVAALFTIRKRYEVFVASVLIAIVNVAVIACTGYIERMIGLAGSEERNLLAQGGIGLASGLASFLVLAILPIFERFGIITDMQLLELTGLHHPILRRLEEEAPGTWQHTLNVAKLAEAAATEIGVNYLLVRAGTYYHDIGKMSKPEYFTENQITPEEKMRHSELKPQMSALIIKNHVKEGVEMARSENLPERVIDFIREHHGTSVISYFYHKALEAHARGETKEPVRIEDYRYPWLKPQTIETAIVMLADSVEATATAKLSNKTVREDDIQQVVRTTIFDKFNDGQFNECNLTLRDLEVIRETFVRVLKSRFHTRIDYPKKPAATGRSNSREIQREDAPRRSQETVRRLEQQP